jgi:hypothetical protein
MLTRVRIHIGILAGIAISMLVVKVPTHINGSTWDVGLLLWLYLIVRSRMELMASWTTDTAVTMTVVEVVVRFRAPKSTTPIPGAIRISRHTSVKVWLMLLLWWRMVLWELLRMQLLQRLLLVLRLFFLLYLCFLLLWLVICVLYRNDWQIRTLLATRSTGFSSCSSGSITLTRFGRTSVREIQMREVHGKDDNDDNKDNNHTYLRLLILTT